MKVLNKEKKILQHLRIIVQNLYFIVINISMRKQSVHEINTTRFTKTNEMSTKIITKIYNLAAVFIFILKPTYINKNFP